MMMCMCSFILECVTTIVYVFVLVSLIAYMSRMMSGFHPPKRKFVVICLMQLLMLGICLYLHIHSECSLLYINLGAILCALWFCLSCIETSNYIISCRLNPETTF